ncbi:MAG: HAD family phosphatase [Elusimicrobiaceae bacterium]|nr:HAD family phosphatase [Elusimicrobiaceae bacterium]
MNFQKVYTLGVAVTLAAFISVAADVPKRVSRVYKGIKNLPEVQFVQPIPSDVVRYTPSFQFKNPQRIIPPVQLVQNWNGVPPVNITTKVLVPPLVVRAAVQAQPLGKNVFPGKEQIDAVIFDMDGTLLDSLPAWDHACAKYLRTRGIEMPEEMDAHIKKLSLLEGARYIIDNLGLPDSPEELLAATLDSVRMHYLTDILPKPGAVQLLKELKAQGIKISVATSSDKELAQAAFTRLGMMEYIDFIITCDDVGTGKREPAIYEAALYLLGTQKSRTLVVEDALYALKTAKKAGFLTAGVWDASYETFHEQQLQTTGDYFFKSFVVTLP